MKIKTFYSPTIQNFDNLPKNVDIAILWDHVGKDTEHGQVADIITRLQDVNVQSVVLDYLCFENFPKNFKRVAFVPFELILFIKEHCDNFTAPVVENKTSAFNFMINKMRFNRRALVRTVTANSLSTSTYSLCTQEDYYGWKPRYHLFNGDRHKGDIIFLANTSSGNYTGWVGPNVFEPSVISLITEPGAHSLSAFVTEKTLYAFEGQTIPIWAGGYRHAEMFRNMGFDMFDDLIDHSYSEHPDENKRIELAVTLNKTVLQDTQSLINYYNNNKERFVYNQQLMRSGRVYNHSVDNLKTAGFTEYETQAILKENSIPNLNH